MNVFETMKYKNEILKDGENTLFTVLNGGSSDMDKILFV